MLSILFTIIIVGVVLWAVNSLVPMQAQVKTILNVVVIIMLLIWLMYLFTGAGPSLPRMR